MKMSIIVPVYNAEKYLKRCLDSVKKMKEIDWECIVIEDGSQDNSPAIADEYAREDERFQVQHIRRNAGVSNARNVGLNLSCSEAVFFLDADDWLLDNAEGRLQKGLMLLKQGKTVIFGHIKVYPGGKTKEYQYPDVNDLDEKEAVKQLAITDQKMNTCWGILFDRQIIIQHQIRFDTSMKVGEDACFVMEYLKYRTSLYVCADPIIAYWQNRSGAMGTAAMKTFYDEEKTFAHREMLIRELDLNVNQKEYMRMCNIYFSKLLEYTANESRNSGRSMIRAMKKYYEMPYVQKIISNCDKTGFHILKQAALRMAKKRHYFGLYVTAKLYGTILQIRSKRYMTQIGRGETH